MKTFLIGLIFLGFTSLGHSQVNGETKVKEEALDVITVTRLNLSYLKKVQDENTPKRVKALENRAARYDITESPVFDRKFESYEVLFEQTKGRIVATFDQEGKIINSLERFDDVLLPPEVRNTIFKEYPGWSIHKDMYLVSYYHDKDVKKTYKVQIRKEKQKKNLKIDSQGKIM